MRQGIPAPIRSRIPVLHRSGLGTWAGSGTFRNMLRPGEIIFFKSQILVIRHQVNRDVMYLRENVFSPEEIVQFLAFIYLDNI
jgi:hypothetical protein